MQGSSVDTTPSDTEALRRASLEVADDLLVMLSDDRGKYRLVAAPLCSPSDWRLEEKLGDQVNPNSDHLCYRGERQSLWRPRGNDSRSCL